MTNKKNTSNFRNLNLFLSRVLTGGLVFAALIFSQNALPQQAPPLESEFIMRITLSASGQVNAGETRVAPITGGSFSGPGIQGTVHPGGADWMTISEGHNNLDVRIMLETDDGAFIYMSYTGVLMPSDNPEDTYWVVTPSFQTASEKYDWLNHIVAVGRNNNVTQGVSYDIYRIL